MNADDSAIKAAFRLRAKHHHPDLHPEDPVALVQLRQLIRARDALLDPDRRRSVDEKLILQRKIRLAAIASVTAVSACIGIWYASLAHLGDAAATAPRQTALHNKETMCPERNTDCKTRQHCISTARICGLTPSH